MIALHTLRQRYSLQHALTLPHHLPSNSLKTLQYVPGKAPL